MRKSYGFRTYPVLELALYHSLGKLPEPESTLISSEEPIDKRTQTSPAGSEGNAPELVGQVACWKREFAGQPKE